MACQKLGKTGTIKGIKDDEWERKKSGTRHYHVEYDDGSFDTYESENDLIEIPSDSNF
jgi:hypothetical protein